jgi:lysine decarboxylase
MGKSMETGSSILHFLMEQSGHVSFHMPGHKGADFYRRYGYDAFLDRMADCDLTEIPGADNLFQAEGIIRTVQERYAALYQVDRSYLLVNGSSGGILASILTAVPAGERLIIARNSHKSAFNALRLGRINPVYAYPDRIEPYGIAGGISLGEIERCLAEAPDAAAVFLPSPNYYGMCSDLPAIADRVHAAGKILIVDQAHGAHLKFFEKYRSNRPPTGLEPVSAETAGADLIVNSIHKTMASFTQSALLNLRGNRVNQALLEDRLQMIQTTSPSYLLMASLDINLELIETHGAELITQWQEQLEHFYQEALRFPELDPLTGLPGFDHSKININAAALGMTGAELESALISKNIYAELFSGHILMLMTGIGNQASDYDQLLEALKEIIRERPQAQLGSPVNGLAEKVKQSKPQILPPDINERKILQPPPERLRKIPLLESAGKTCGIAIIPYPPGIPLVCPGEIISEDDITEVIAIRRAGRKVLGISRCDKVSVGPKD